VAEKERRRECAARRRTGRSKGKIDERPDLKRCSPGGRTKPGKIQKTATGEMSKLEEVFRKRGDAESMGESQSGLFQADHEGGGR